MESRRPFQHLARDSAGFDSSPAREVPTRTRHAVVSLFTFTAAVVSAGCSGSDDAPAIDGDASGTDTDDVGASPDSSARTDSGLDSRIDGGRDTGNGADTADTTPPPKVGTTASLALLETTDLHTNILGYDVARRGGGWDRFATSPGRMPAGGSLILEVRSSDRCVGRVELAKTGLGSTQRETVRALLPLLFRSLLPAAHDCPRPARTDGSPRAPPMALQLAAATWAATPRETDVLARLVCGESNRSIALALNCTEGTLEHHVRALFRKSGASARSELVAQFWSQFARL